MPNGNPFPLKSRIRELRFTPKHIAVLEYTALGWNYKETSAKTSRELKIKVAPKTVEHYLYFMRESLNMRNTTQLIAEAIRNGIIK